MLLANQQQNQVMPSAGPIGYATIEGAWATTGYDEKKRTKDPLCQLYGDQFRKVQNALWQSKFPEYDQYFPFEKAETKPIKAPRKVAVDTTADEQLLERYIETGEVAPPPTALSIPAIASPPSAAAAAPPPTISLKSQIMELVIFVACGLLLIALLDLFFRIGFSYGQRAAT